MSRQGPLYVPFSDARARSGELDVRLIYASATSLSIEGFGRRGEVNGGLMACSSLAPLVSTSENTIDAAGADSGNPPSASTLHYVYLRQSGTLALSETSPTAVDGVPYLGASDEAAMWAFVGWAYVNASTEFEDSDTARHVISKYGRRPKRLLARPAYTNNNAATTFALNTATWAALNAGTGDSVSYISNPDLPVQGEAVFTLGAATTGVVHVGVGYNGTTPDFAAGFGNLSLAGSSVAVPIYVAAANPVTAKTLDLVAMTSAAAATFAADLARNGASADPCATFLLAWVWG